MFDTHILSPMEFPIYAHMSRILEQNSYIDLIHFEEKKKTSFNVREHSAPGFFFLHRSYYSSLTSLIIHYYDVTSPNHLFVHTYSNYEPTEVNIYKIERENWPLFEVIGDNFDVASFLLDQTQFLLPTETKSFNVDKRKNLSERKKSNRSQEMNNH